MNKYLLLSFILTLIVFLSGVYLGILISKPQIKEKCGFEKISYAWESLLNTYREKLPYRLEEGNYDRNVLKTYMELEYFYYNQYLQYYKECNFKPPVIYIANLSEKSVKCGKNLDKTKNLRYLFVFIDDNFQITNLIKEKYKIKQIPALIVCDKYVISCDDNIEKFLKMC
jgi:hypothetical protein